MQIIQVLESKRLPKSISRSIVSVNQYTYLRNIFFFK